MLKCIYEDNGQWGYKRLRINGESVLEHRYIMEQHLGRKLFSGEHVHHKDGNKHNNDISNLSIVTAKTHPNEHRRNVLLVTLKCPKCGSEFSRTARYVRMKKKLGQKNFLCGRKCRMLKKQGAMV